MTQIYPLSKENREYYAQKSREYKLLKQQTEKVNQIIDNIPKELETIITLTDKITDDAKFKETIKNQITKLQNPFRLLNTKYLSMIESIDAYVSANKPKISGAEKICDACDMQSSFYIGNNNNNEPGSLDTYKCGVCYKETTEPHPSDSDEITIEDDNNEEIKNNIETIVNKR
jgi:hypothetical protein